MECGTSAIALSSAHTPGGLVGALQSRFVNLFCRRLPPNASHDPLHQLQLRVAVTVLGPRRRRAKVKADPFQVGDVLKDPKRFIVPIYQRTYAWTPERQLTKLFDSIEAKARERLAGSSPAYPHYMGALLLSPRGKFTFGSIPIFDVVDGQQRLTTYQIFVAALRDTARSLSDAPLADQLTPFLQNTDNRLMKDPKVERFKLQATQYDRALFHDVVDLDRDGLRVTAQAG
jgi:hypothetical protein